MPIIPTYNPNPASLEPYQFTFGGLLMGAGTNFELQKMDGWDLPIVQSQDTQKPRDHGEFIGLDLLGGRDFTVTVQIGPPWTGPFPNLQAAEQAFTSACGFGGGVVAGNQELPFTFQLPNWSTPLSVNCRVRKRTRTMDTAYALGNLATWTMEFHATDPRAYGPTQITTGILGAGNVGGVSFPLTFPITWGSAARGLTQIYNPGDFESRPLLFIGGPITTPRITNESAAGGPSLCLSNPTQWGGYTVMPGDDLVIDLYSRSIQYYTAGTYTGSSRRGWLVAGSQWWNLVPGYNNIRFSSLDVTMPAASLSIVWAPAYQL